MLTTSPRTSRIRDFFIPGQPTTREDIRMELLPGVILTLSILPTGGWGVVGFARTCSSTTPSFHPLLPLISAFILLALK